MFPTLEGTKMNIKWIKIHKNFVLHDHKLSGHVISICMQGFTNEPINEIILMKSLIFNDRTPYTNGNKKKRKGIKSKGKRRNIRQIIFNVSSRSKNKKNKKINPLKIDETMMIK